MIRQGGVGYAVHAMVRVAVCLWMLVWGAGLDGTAKEARPITGDAKQAFVQAWGDRLQSIRSLHMTFTQVKHLRQLRQPLEAAGELWLKGDTLLYVLKDANGATELAMHLEPGSVRMYYPQLQTLEVLALATEQTPVTMVPFLTREPEALLRDYDSTLMVEAGRHILTLVPRDTASALAELRFTLEDFRPRVFQQVDKSGNRLVMHITTFEPNVDIRDAQLELHVPAGVEVIRPAR